MKVTGFSQGYALYIPQHFLTRSNQTEALYSGLHDIRPTSGIHPRQGATYPMHTRLASVYRRRALATSSRGKLAPTNLRRSGKRKLKGTYVQIRVENPTLEPRLAEEN